MPDARLKHHMATLRRKCRRMEDERAGQGAAATIRVPCWLMLEILDAAEPQAAFELEETG